MQLTRTLSMILALAGASIAAAAPPPAKAPAPAPGDKKAPAREEYARADVEKAEKFFDELHGAVMKHQDACPKMGAAFHTVLDKHEEWIKKMIASGKDLPQAARDKLQKRQQEMMGGIGKCREDKAVQAATQRFWGYLVAKKLADKPEAAPPPKK